MCQSSLSGLSVSIDCHNLKALSANERRGRGGDFPLSPRYRVFHQLYWLNSTRKCRSYSTISGSSMTSPNITSTALYRKYLESQKIDSTEFWTNIQNQTKYFSGYFGIKLPFENVSYAFWRLPFVSFFQ